MFSSLSFIVLCFTFKSVCYFELIFVYHVRFREWPTSWIRLELETQEGDEMLRLGGQEGKDSSWKADLTFLLSWLPAPAETAGSLRLCLPLCLPVLLPACTLQALFEPHTVTPSSAGCFWLFVALCLLCELMPLRLEMYADCLTS